MVRSIVDEKMALTHGVLGARSASKTLASTLVGAGRSPTT